MTWQRHVPSPVVSLHMARYEVEFWRCVDYGRCLGLSEDGVREVIRAVDLRHQSLLTPFSWDEVRDAIVLAALGPMPTGPIFGRRLRCSAMHAAYRRKTRRRGRNGRIGS